MMKIIKKILIIIILILLLVALNYGLKSNPKIAIRSKLFFDGHIKTALVAEIEEDKVLSKRKSVKTYLRKQNANCYLIKTDYKLDNPSVKNFIVFKKGKFYEVKYLDDLTEAINGV